VDAARTPNATTEREVQNVSARKASMATGKLAQASVYYTLQYEA